MINPQYLEVKTLLRGGQNSVITDGQCAVDVSSLESFNKGGHGSKHQNILSSISFASTNRKCQFTQTKWMSCPQRNNH
jgi:hypothetical protein